MKRTLLAIFRTGQRCCYYPLADDQNGSPTENQQTRVQVHSRAVCRDNGRDKIRTLFFLLNVAVRKGAFHAQFRRSWTGTRHSAATLPPSPAGLRTHRVALGLLLPAGQRTKRSRD